MSELSNLNAWQLLWDAGIVVKSVIFILLFSSILSWGIFFYKRKIINEIDISDKKFLLEYQSAKNFQVLLSMESDFTDSSLFNIFKTGHEELQRLKDRSRGDNSIELLKDHFSRFGLASIERAMKKSSNDVNILLEKNLSILGSIGSLTPFIGLLGTVWGIINSFTGLASGGATLDVVAPGIAEALIATAIGLFAAIPAVYFYNFFINKNLVINSKIDSFGQDFLNVIERSLLNK